MEAGSIEAATAAALCAAAAAGGWECVGGEIVDRCVHVAGQRGDGHESVIDSCDRMSECSAAEPYAATAAGDGDGRTVTRRGGGMAAGPPEP